MNCCNRTPNADHGNQSYLGTGFRRNPNCIKEDVPASYFSPTLRIVHRKKLQAKNIAPAVSTRSALTSEESFEMGVSKLLKRK